MIVNNLNEKFKVMNKLLVTNIILNRLIYIDKQLKDKVSNLQ